MTLLVMGWKSFSRKLNSSKSVRYLFDIGLSKIPLIKVGKKALDLCSNQTFKTPLNIFQLNGHQTLLTRSKTLLEVESPLTTPQINKDTYRLWRQKILDVPFWPRLSPSWYSVIGNPFSHSFKAGHTLHTHKNELSNQLCWLFNSRQRCVQDVLVVTCNRALELFSLKGTR